VPQSRENRPVKDIAERGQANSTLPVSGKPWSR